MNRIFRIFLLIVISFSIFYFVTKTTYAVCGYAQSAYPVCGCSGTTYWCVDRRLENGCYAPGSCHSGCTAGCADNVYCIPYTGDVQIYCCYYTVWQTNSSNCCTPRVGCSCGSYSSSNSGYGSTTVSCSNGCGGTTSSTCYCTSACSLTSCPSGTSETGSYGFYATYSCTNACGQSRSRSCYCTSQCTLATCPSTYSSANQGYGSLLYDSCTNACGQYRSRTCYCYQCTPPVCPSPLLASQPAVTPNMLLSNFRSCTNDCAVSNYRDCYESPTPLPSGSLTVQPDAINRYGFQSTTHSGIPVVGQYNLNDPVNMTAVFTDSNGASDIEGVFVWLRNSTLSGQITSPLWLSTTAAPQAPSIDSWGFLMRREGSSWVPYVPSYNVSPAVWTRAVYNATTRTFMISGPSRNNMVEVTLTSPIASSGNTVTMIFRMRFSGTGIGQNVSQVRYNAYHLGLDRFSFTPFDNYTFSMAGYWSANQLRYRTSPTPAQTYARDWVDSGIRWTIDKQNPSIVFTNLTPKSDGEQVIVSWQSTDDKNLYTIVGNIFTTAGPDAREITLSTSTPGVSLRAPFVPGSEDSTVIGNFRNTDPWSFRVNPNLNTTSHSGEVRINIGSNRTGTLIIYLSTFDDAGNINQVRGTFNLGDWFVTDGGLAYTRGGTSYVTRVLQDPAATNAWNPNTAPGQVRILPRLRNSVILASESLIPSKADLSSEMWADSVLSPPPSALEKSNIVDSYNIREFAGHNITNYYTTLMKAYQQRRTFLLAESMLTEKTFEGEILLSSPNLNGANYCGNYNQFDYCTLLYTGNLTVQNVTCSHRVAIFVQGNLTIRPPLTVNNVNKDSCIFVVAGDVIIEEGSSASSATIFRYDPVHAYILTDGTVTIRHESSKGAGAIYDGIYINGGVHSMQGTEIYRYLRLQDRLLFPFLAVDNHSKYGVLGGKLFGSNFTLQKTELGFK